MHKVSVKIFEFFINENWSHCVEPQRRMRVQKQCELTIVLFDKCIFNFNFLCFNVFNLHLNYNHEVQACCIAKWPKKMP